jgi:lysophospholipase L1-like esterase
MLLPKGGSDYIRSFFKDNGYIDRGISGQTSYQFLLRLLEDVINLSFKVVIINVTTNDIAENNAKRNYSDGFHKAFYHEKISYLRCKDCEYVTLEVLKLSALLSGTSRQVQSLVPDAENGLFSRFIPECIRPQ